MKCSPTIQVASTQKVLDQAQSELKLLRLKMKECDSEISCILKEQQTLQHKLDETKLERKKLENEVTLFVSIYYISCIFRQLKSVFQLL